MSIKWPAKNSPHLLTCDPFCVMRHCKSPRHIQKTSAFNLSWHLIVGRILALRMQLGWGMNGRPYVWYPIHVLSTAGTHAGSWVGPRLVDHVQNMWSHAHPAFQTTAGFLNSLLVALTWVGPRRVDHRHEHCKPPMWAVSSDPLVKRRKNYGGQRI